MAEKDDDDYSDLVPGARVTHSVHGTTGTVADEPWEFGQVPIRFDIDGLVVFCNPANISTP